MQAPARRLAYALSPILFAAVLLAPPAMAWQPANSYGKANLVSDGFIATPHTDSHLVNPWGIAFNPFAFVWIANNGTDTSTLYDGNGTPSPQPPLIVSVPAKAPTGIVFNGSPTDFTLKKSGQSVPTPFLFVTETGSIAAWAPSINPTEAQTVFTSNSGAIYKGVAIAGTGAGLFLYATDFHNARIDVFDGNFSPATLTGSFDDPNLPPHYAPFNIRNIDGALYVTYALQDKDAEDDVAGPGRGFVDVFKPDGTLIRRLISHGELNAPWGMAVAPAGFGPFSGRLLVGNFGDGKINAYDLATGAFVGTLHRPGGSPLTINGLWGLAFGNGVDNQPTDTLFFTAGPSDESHGLYGRIRFAPGTRAAADDTGD